MRVSKTTFVCEALQQLSSLKYGYRSVVAGCVDELHRQGWECDTPDPELIDEIISEVRKVRKVWESERSTQ